MKKTVLLITTIVLLLLIALTQSHDYNYMKDLKNSTYIEYKSNDTMRNPMTGEIVTPDRYYRTYINETIPVLVNINSGEIMYLTALQASNTRHGAIYNIEMDQTYNIDLDMEIIARAIVLATKGIQEL